MSVATTASAWSPVVLAAGIGVSMFESDAIEVPNDAVITEVSRKASPDTVDRLFGDTSAPGVIAIGVSEGTMRADGSKNKAYDGHTDPGNGAHNKGFGSCQVAACQGKSIEEVDAYLLNRTANVAKGLIERNPDWEEEWIIAGTDLEIQAPLAVPGFERKLNKLKEAGKPIGEEELVKARVQGFYNPSTGKLEAGGFNNDLQRLENDQRRRIQGQAEVLEKVRNLEKSYAGNKCNIIVGVCWIPGT